MLQHCTIKLFISPPIQCTFCNVQGIGCVHPVGVPHPRELLSVAQVAARKGNSKPPGSQLPAAQHQQHRYSTYSSVLQCLLVQKQCLHARVHSDILKALLQPGCRVSCVQGTIAYNNHTIYTAETNTASVAACASASHAEGSIPQQMALFAGNLCRMHRLASVDSHCGAPTSCSVNVAG